MTFTLVQPVDGELRSGSFSECLTDSIHISPVIKTPCKLLVSNKDQVRCLPCDYQKFFATDFGGGSGSGGNFYIPCGDPMEFQRLSGKVREVFFESDFRESSDFHRFVGDFMERPANDAKFIKYVDVEEKRRHWQLFGRTFPKPFSHYFVHKFLTFSSN